MLNYKDMTIDDIIAWCKENGEVAWLKAKVNEKRTYPVYPTVEKTTKKGNKTFAYDKDQEPIGTKEKSISYMELKYDFCIKFMPEIMPEKQKKKASMLELINAL